MTENYLCRTEFIGIGRKTHNFILALQYKVTHKQLVLLLGAFAAYTVDHLVVVTLSLGLRRSRRPQSLRKRTPRKRGILAQRSIPQSGQSCNKACCISVDLR